MGDSAYAPNVKRARVINEQIKTVRNGINQKIIELLDKGIIQEEPPIHYEPLNLPGISRALLYESQGSLNKIFELANEAREDCKPLRTRIKETLSTDASKEEWFILEEELNELINSIALGKQKILKEGPSLESLGPIPIPSLKNIMEVRKNLQTKDEMNVITEFARSVNFPFKKTDSFQCLFKETHKK